MRAPHESPRFKFFARIDDAPGSLARLLVPFDVLGLTPVDLSLRRSARASLFVTATFEGLDFERAVAVTRRIAQFPTVRGARCAVVEEPRLYKERLPCPITTRLSR